jgi:hypothetical protein
MRVNIDTCSWGKSRKRSHAAAVCRLMRPRDAKETQRFGVSKRLERTLFVGLFVSCIPEFPVSWFVVLFQFPGVPVPHHALFVFCIPFHQPTASSHAENEVP